MATKNGVPFRKMLVASINNYSGTPTQNTQLLKKLRG